MKNISVLTAIAYGVVAIGALCSRYGMADPNVNVVDYQRVIQTSSGNECYFESYKNGRGKAPRQLIEGLIANYTEELCFPSGASSEILGPSHKDALAYYKSPAKIENLYALMIGSGMQESSGGIDCGQDTSAPENRTDKKAEAGIFQTSYNSIDRSVELAKLYDDAKTGSVQCFSELYIACSGIDRASGLSRLKNWGAGEGVNFQATTKACPGFAAKYHSIMLRVDRTHYGPINSMADEMKPSCVKMFSELGAFISANREVCQPQ